MLWDSCNSCRYENLLSYNYSIKDSLLFLFVLFLMMIFKSFVTTCPIQLPDMTINISEIICSNLFISDTIRDLKR